MKVPNRLIPEIYKISKEVYEKKRLLNEGISILSDQYGMNPTTAHAFIYNFRYYVDGRKFTRTNNTYSTYYFLEKIFVDYGSPGLENALNALKLHIEYYKAKTGIILHSKKDIYDSFLEKISSKGVEKEVQVIEIRISTGEDNEEQNEIIKTVHNQIWSKHDILIELRNIKENEPETVQIKGVKYKRSNYNIALRKELRGHKCQICQKYIIKRDGTKYVEAAHIIAKNDKGGETLKNIILLCPNHHKEFDLGKRDKVIFNETNVEFFLDDKKYQLFYEPDSIS